MSVVKDYNTISHDEKECGVEKVRNREAKKTWIRGKEDGMKPIRVDRLPVLTDVRNIIEIKSNKQ